MLEALIAALLGAAFEFLRGLIADRQAAQAQRDLGAATAAASINRQAAEIADDIAQIAGNRPTLTMLLGGCPEGSSDVRVTAVVCPVLQQYSLAEQDRMLAEYEALPSGSMLKRTIADYMNLRDQVRACRARIK